jgi:hypothetical protein
MYIAEQNRLFFSPFPQACIDGPVFINPTLTLPQYVIVLFCKKVRRAKLKLSPLSLADTLWFFAAVKILKYCDTLSTSDKLFSTRINFLFQVLLAKKDISVQEVGSEH